MINRPGFDDFEAKPTLALPAPNENEPPPISTEARKELIREMNDKFRKTLTGGEVFCTSGIVALGTLPQLEVLDQVRAFETFTLENDPHQEHDFGSFEREDGTKIYWKIDYYDQDLQGGSPDPSDDSVTRRVLTVMLAEEY